MKSKKFLSLVLSIMIIAGVVSSSVFISTSAATTAPITVTASQENPDYLKPDKKFKKAQADFSVKLFKNTLKKGENTLISPQSVMYALAMTANGARGKTKKQMEKVLGSGMKINNLNKYLGYTMSKLPNKDYCKVNIANSIWYDGSNGEIAIKKAFLNKNKKYYNASINDVPFDDNSTVDKINRWCSDNTDGMIDRIIDNISEDAIMYLINAVSFDAKWEIPYKKNEVEKKKFTSYSGKQHKVKMLNGNEYSYISDKNAKGFLKYYQGGRYSFAALLPNKDTDIYKYAKSLTGDKLRKILNKKSNERVITSIPKFKYDYKKVLNNSLKKMGIKKAFNRYNANFKDMAKFSPNYNIFINMVQHKTFIQLDELGTKAGAVTVVAMVGASSAPSKPKKVILNRPFIYMIVDNKTNLPVFMGTVVDL